VFAVLGASGNTGRVVAETLLSQNKKVRVVVRDVAKGQVWREAGADVSIADVEDNAALTRAFSDTEGAYVLLPPNFSSSHVRADNRRRASTIAAAVEAAGVPHVVLLSSIGAQQADGTGPVLGLRDAEAAFTRGRAAATFVRSAYFMENWGGALYAVSIGGLLLQSTLPISVTYAQTFTKGGAATVSSLMMGFAWGMGGMMVPVIGKIADVAGLKKALMLIVLLPTFGFLLSLLLPKKVSVKEVAPVPVIIE
jgi:hypothetical protein